MHSTFKLKSAIAAILSAGLLGVAHADQQGQDVRLQEHNLSVTLPAPQEVFTTQSFAVPKDRWVKIRLVSRMASVPGIAMQELPMIFVDSKSGLAHYRYGEDAYTPAFSAPCTATPFIPCGTVTGALLRYPNPALNGSFDFTYLLQHAPGASSMKLDVFGGTELDASRYHEPVRINLQMTY